MGRSEKKRNWEWNWLYEKKTWQIDKERERENGYWMRNPFLFKETVLFQTIQFGVSTRFNCKKTSLF